MKIDPWGSVRIEDYSKLFDEFGIARFEGMLRKLPDAHRLMRRKVIFGHRGYEMIVDAIVRGEPFAVMSGFMPSGKVHLGGKMVMEEIIYHQQMGGDAFVAIADMEAHSVRGISWRDCERLGVEEYILSLIALGFKPEGHIYFQSKSRTIQDLLFELGTKEALLTAIRLYYDVGAWQKVSSSLARAESLDYVEEKVEGELKMRGAVANLMLNEKPSSDKILSLAEEYPDIADLEDYLLTAVSLFDSLNQPEDEIRLLEWLMAYPLPDTLWAETGYKLEQAYIRIDEVSKAEKIVSRLQQEAPESKFIPLAFELLGDYYANKGMNKKASFYFQQAIDTATEDNQLAKSALKAAIAYRSYGLQRESKKLLRLARTKATDQELRQEAILEEVSLYLEEGDVEDGLSLAFKELPNFSEPLKEELLVLIGDLYFGIGEDSLALLHYKMALENSGMKDEAKALVIMRVAELLMSSGNLGEAESLLKVLIKISENDSLVAKARRKIKGVER